VSRSAALETANETLKGAQQRLDALTHSISRELSAPFHDIDRPHCGAHAA
jgi:hypothetical protein